MYKLNLWVISNHCKFSSQDYRISEKLLNTVNYFNNSVKSFVSKAKLKQFGKLNQSQANSNYEVGQMFLHRVFAYRGVILHPWLVHVCEKDRESSMNEKNNGSLHATYKKMIYYQVLMDTRDNDHSSANCEVTYLRNPGNENYPIETISGVDYVSHDDIIPYTSVEHVPILHTLFDTFIDKAENKLAGTKLLKKFQKRNKSWLQPCCVYVETSNDIRVTAIPFYLGMKILVDPPVYWWRYSIRMENLGNDPIQLRKVNWRIISDSNVCRQPVHGVVGKEPILSSERPAFQYSSQVSLWTPNGHMWGTYTFDRGDEQISASIPAFSLESSSSADSEKTAC